MKARWTLLLPWTIAFVGCSGRPVSYDAPVSNVQALALTNQVALTDDGAHRIVLLTPHANQELERTSVAVGKAILRAEVSSDGKRLFVLTAGDVVRKKGKEERAALTIIEHDVGRRIELESPHTGLVSDPLGRWVALYTAPATNGANGTALPRDYIENPNEIVLIDLAAATPAEAVVARTLRSFGGRPQRVSFTQSLHLPGGERRLLVVETDQDVTVLDLDNVHANPPRPEITVRLTTGSTARSVKPAQVVVDDGDPTKNDDARIGVRVENDSSVFILTFVEARPGSAPADPGTVPNDFRPEVNLTDVGGPPGDIAFVRTDVGLRLAAVVPGTTSAVLVEPATSITTEVKLPQPYSNLSLVTNAVGGTSGTDTVLLYGSGNSRGVAFWSLGRAEAEPYRSVEVVPLSLGIQHVLDVPAPRPEIKVLQGNTPNGASTAGTNGLFVLNLASRTASPLAALTAPSVHISPDGERFWAFQHGGQNLASVSLSNLHPSPLPLDRPIDAVFDVARPEGGRSLIAIDTRGGVGATVLDALAPDTTTSRSFYGILLEDLR